MFDLDAFSAENRERCEALNGFCHPLASWSLSDWLVAALGELGEAANVAKKLNRVRDGVIGNHETEAELRVKLASEIADTFIYLDLLAQSQGLRLSEIVRETFEKKSAMIGYTRPAAHIPTERKADERTVTDGIALIQAEQARAIAKGYDAAHDDAHTALYFNCGELANAAFVAINAAKYGSAHAHANHQWFANTPQEHTTLEWLAIAGQLIAAEIGRIQRAEARAQITPTEHPTNA